MEPQDIIRGLDAIRDCMEHDGFKKHWMKVIDAAINYIGDTITVRVDNYDCDGCEYQNADGSCRYEHIDTEYDGDVLLPCGKNEMV